VKLWFAGTCTFKFIPQELPLQFSPTREIWLVVFQYKIEATIGEESQRTGQLIALCLLCLPVEPLNMHQCDYPHENKSQSGDEDEATTGLLSQRQKKPRVARPNNQRGVILTIVLLGAVIIVQSAFTTWIYLKPDRHLAAPRIVRQ